MSAACESSSTPTTNNDHLRSTGYRSSSKCLPRGGSRQCLTHSHRPYTIGQCLCTRFRMIIIPATRFSSSVEGWVCFHPLSSRERDASISLCLLKTHVYNVKIGCSYTTRLWNNRILGRFDILFDIQGDRTTLRMNILQCITDI
jgi:hypothetical protein